MFSASDYQLVDFGIRPQRWSGLHRSTSIARTGLPRDALVEPADPHGLWPAATAPLRSCTTGTEGKWTYHCRPAGALEHRLAATGV